MYPSDIFQVYIIILLLLSQLIELGLLLPQLIELNLGLLLLKNHCVMGPSSIFNWSTYIYVKTIHVPKQGLLCIYKIFYNSNHFCIYKILAYSIIAYSISYF